MVKDLAVAVFGRETLATHGLSGRAGNANKGTTAKPALDQDKVMLILGELNVFFFLCTNIRAALVTVTVQNVNH